MLSKKEIENLGKQDVLPPPVLSIYLNTDRKKPEGVRYLAQLRRLLTLSYKKMRGQLKNAEQTNEIIHADILPRLLNFLDNDVLPHPSIRSFAAFVSLKHHPKKNIYPIITFTLPQSIKSQFHFGHNAYVTPLLFLLDQCQPYAVITINRHNALFLLVSLGEINHCAEFASDVPHRNDQGGWSQKRFERRFDKALEKHARGVAGYAVKYLKNNPVERLIIGGDPDILQLLKKSLPKKMREQIIGDIPSRPHELKHETLERAAPLAAQAEKEAESHTVAELRSALSHAGYAAAGIEPVLRAINERRAKKIIVLAGYEEKGYLCPNCHSLNFLPALCYVCGHAAAPVEDIVEEAVERAYNNEAKIEFVENNLDLEALGKIGAILRY